MKKYTSHTITAVMLAIILALSFAGCQKGGINGDLDGQWRIQSIEHLPGGEISYPQDHFICIYLHTVNLSTGFVKATGKMVHESDRIALEFPYNTDNVSLNPWGIYSWQTTFDIEHLTGKDLTLRSDSAIIMLSKF